MARVRFDVGFEDPVWCNRNHVILVEEGALTLELEEEIITVMTGEIIRLGEARHRASNRGSVPTTLLIISDLIEPIGRTQPH